MTTYLYDVWINSESSYHDHLCLLQEVNLNSVRTFLLWPIVCITEGGCKSTASLIMSTCRYYKGWTWTQSESFYYDHLSRYYDHFVPGGGGELSEPRREHTVVFSRPLSNAQTSVTGDYSCQCSTLWITIDFFH